MLYHMLRERLSRAPELARVPEPALSMEDPAQVEAFVHSGQPDGLLAPLYFFHAVHSLAEIGRAHV